MKQIAIKAACKAGKILMKHYQSLSRADVWKKSEHEIVTKVDMEANRAIIKTIKSKYKNHDFLSEETGLEDNPEKYIWIIDPLDGTTNYTTKYPIFATSIALAYQAKIILGVTYSPITNEIFIAERGKGATLNGKKIQVSKISALNKSVITYGYSHSERSYTRAIKIYSRMFERARNVRHYGSATLELAYVAAGRTEAEYLPGKINIWDVAAGVLLVEEAGGKVTDFKGFECEWGCRDILASNGKIHKDFLKHLKKC